MKFVKYLLTAITAIVFIAACQKELDFVTDGLAHGSLKSDLTGDCLPSTINGIYKADSLLDNTNFVDIQVDLAAVGTYDIKSDTVNGYSFRGTGTLGITGINTVRLYASGKPVLSGTDVFTIRFDSTICILNVTVIGASTGVAVYTLGGSPATCSGAIINGTYTVGTALDVNTTVTVTVNVTATGTYSFGTDTVNGMVFTSVGVFTTLGVQAVTLNGAGTPLAAGIFNLTATNISSNCTFSVTVGGGSPAVFSLDGTPNACAGATVTGSYTVGTALTTNEKVMLNVTVSSIGSYSITSNTINGMTFTRSSNFVSTGPANIFLIGSGTPIASGTFDFIFTGGGTTCTFSVTVNPSINLDYIPETAFSNWSDRLVGGTATDTSYVQVSPNSIIKNTITYKIFELKTLGVAVDSSFHRKNGGMYYQLYNDAFGLFDAPFNKDGLLLDSNLAVNASWLTDLGTNTWNGLPATGLIECVIMAKGATAVIAGNTYNNIIKVQYIFNYNTGGGNIVYATEESWYAKGKGLVYDKYQDSPVTFTLESETTRIQIF
ncbi:MAG: hypothetical protein ABI741_04795 [Ferruginibacter sp.]